MFLFMVFSVNYKFNDVGVFSLCFVLFYFKRRYYILYLFKLFIIIGIDIRRLMVVFVFGKNSIRVLSF